MRINELLKLIFLLPALALAAIILGMLNGGPDMSFLNLCLTGLLSVVLIFVVCCSKLVLWGFICDFWNWIGRATTNLWHWICAVWNWICGLMTNLNLMFVVIFSGLAVLVVPHWGEASWRELATPMLGALACLAAGGVVGFLFGIPRTSTPNMNQGRQTPTPAGTPPPATPTASASSQNSAQNHSGHDVNNSLEQISDWLTKIVVGLGLVEMKNFPGYLESMAERFEEDLGWPVNRSFAIALMVFFTAMGFLYVYVLTRLRLSPEFRRADEYVRGQSDLEKVKEDVKYNDLKTAITFGHQTLNLNNESYLDDAIRGLKAARDQFLESRRAAIVLGKLYVKKKDYGAAIAVLNETLTEMDKCRTTTPKDKADLLYNIACYLCLRQSQPSTGPAGRTEDLKEMYKKLTESIRLSPENAEDAASDEDFKLVRHKGDFIRLVYDDAIRSLDNKLHTMNRLSDAEKDSEKISKIRYQLAQYYAVRSTLDGRSADDKEMDCQKIKEMLTKSRDDHRSEKFTNAVWRESILKDDYFRKYRELNPNFGATLLTIAPDPCPAAPAQQLPTNPAGENQTNQPA